MACENAAAERVVLHSIAKLLSPAFSAEGSVPAVHQSAADVERQLEKRLENVTFKRVGL